MSISGSSCVSAASYACTKGDELYIHSSMDEERQEDFRSRVSFSLAELIMTILLPTKLSYSNSIERLNSLLGDCFPFRFHLRGGWERALSSAVLKRLKSAAGFVSDIVGLSVGFQIATSSGFSNQSRHAVRTGDEAGYCKGGWRVRNRKYLRV